MADRSVVRNEKYRRGGLNKRERHNERKNMEYQNDDIIPARFPYNVHFKQCEGAGYAATFDRMVADGTISTRGLTQDPYIVDEFVFDVNSAYFENNGGYDFACRFFEEAYRCAVNLIGGEQYVLSAVMHADERNKALSEQAGHDVYHYHLHVVYIPCVQKEVYYRKDNKNPDLAGKLREVITQVSHSKKWPRYKGDDGKWVNSYSVMQDSFFEHMKAAGFEGFERGERGSTAEHLSVTEYKTQQEKARADKEARRAAKYRKEVEQKQIESEKLDKKLAVQKKTEADIAALENVGKTNLVGQIVVTPEELKTLRSIIKKEAKAQDTITEQKAQIDRLTTDVGRLKYRLQGFEGKGITENLKLFQAQQRAPRRMADTIADIMRQPPERSGQERTAPEHKRSTGLEH